VVSSMRNLNGGNVTIQECHGRLCGMHVGVEIASEPVRIR